MRPVGRTGEQEEGVRGRETSVGEDCLSEEVVYTRQTLIIIIIICKGHSKQSGYLSAGTDPCLTLDSSVSVKNSQEASGQ